MYLVRIANLSLILTNFFVLIYNSVLNYLNFTFPPRLTQEFYRPQASFPEPFEIPLFIILMFLCSLTIILAHNLLNRFTLFQAKNNLLTIVGFIFLLFTFMQKLGDFPLSGEPHPYQIRLDTSIHVVIVLIYLASLCFITVQSSIFQRLFLKRQSILFVGIIILIAFLTFEPRFPVTVLNYAFFHGPTWEVLQGKTIYNQAPSQYGFLLILVLAGVSRLGIDLLYLPIIIWILTICQYFLCFYLVFKVSKSLPFSLLALFSILTINYFSYIQSPQSGPLRWLPMVFLLFILFKRKYLSSRIFIISLATACFWLIDIGLYIFLAYFLTLTILYLSKKIDLKTISQSTFMFFASIAIFFIFLESIHLILGFQLINPSTIFTSVIKHAGSGLVMVPMPFQTYFWLVPLTYFTSFIYYIKQTRAELVDARGSNLAGHNLSEGSPQQNLPLLIIFSANLMLFASIYYVGRSAPDYLLKISVIFLLCLFLLIAIIYQRLNSKKIKFIILTFTFLFLIAIPTWQRKEYFAESTREKTQSLMNKNVLKPELIDKIETFYNAEKKLIMENFPGKEIVLLSTDDTYLLYLTNKKNLLDANPQVGLDTKIELEKATRRIVQECPQKMLIDCSTVNKCQPYSTLSHGFNIIPHLLSYVEATCKTHYLPTFCTEKLCIAEKEI